MLNFRGVCVDLWWYVLICFVKWKAMSHRVDVARNSNNHFKLPFFFEGTGRSIGSLGARYLDIPQRPWWTTRHPLGVIILWGLKLLFPSSVKCHILTLPKFNSSPLKIYHPKRKRSSSNYPFCKDEHVSFREANGASCGDLRTWSSYKSLTWMGTLDRW